MQLLLVAKPQGVVGVAAVRLEEVWRHVAARPLSQLGKRVYRQTGGLANR